MSSDIMKGYVKSNIIMAQADSSVQEIYSLMKKNNIRHIPVVQNGEAIGIISDRDVNFVNQASSDLSLKAEDIMTSEPYSVDEQMSVPHVVKIMSQRKFNSVLIHNDEKKIVGIFTSSDALDILSDHFANINS